MERHEPPIPNIRGGKEAAQLGSLTGRLSQLERQAQQSTFLASAYRNSAQTLAKGTNIVEVDTVVIGNSELISSHKYKAPVTGVYMATGCVGATFAAGIDTLVSIFHNGEEAVRGSRLLTSASLYNLVVSGPVFVQAGDAIDLRVYTAGGGEALEIGFVENRLTVFRIG